MTKDDEKVRKHRENFDKNVKEMKHSWQELKAAVRQARGVLIGLAVIGGLWMLIPSVSDEERYCGDTIRAKNSAYVSAMIFIELRLRDPASAVHPPEPISVSWLGGCDYRVTGSVRARNGFGDYSQHVYVMHTRYDLETSTPSARLISFE